MPLCLLNHCMSRRRFVQSGVHLMASLVAWKTVQAIHPTDPQVLAQASGPARAYGAGAYGQSAYAGNACDQGGCEQQTRRSKTVVSVYLPLVNK
jgi:hypothetical protein